MNVFGFNYLDAITGLFAMFLYGFIFSAILYFLRFMILEFIVHKRGAN